MPRSTKLPIQREDRRQAALLRAKVEVGIVLRDMMSAADASDYFQREGVPADVASRLLQRDEAENRPDHRAPPQPAPQAAVQQEPVPETEPEALKKE